MLILTILSLFSTVFVCGVLTPIIVGAVRRRARGSALPTAPVSDPMTNARMERLEHAVDAIAIEVERIAEETALRHEADDRASGRVGAGINRTDSLRRTAVGAPVHYSSLRS
jgi:hypothetical protein